MNKKNVINTPATHSVSSDSSSARRKTEVSAQITLSDSILTGAIVEYRKAGYNFIRHMHTNIEIYRILSGECYMDIQSETLHCTEGDFIMILPDVVHSFYLNDPQTANSSIFILIRICFPLLCLKMTGFSRLPFFMPYCFLRIFTTGSDRML